MEKNIIEIPAQFVERIFQLSAETGLTVEEIVESAIKNYINREE